MKAVFVLFTLFAATVFFPVKAFAFDVTGKVLSKETAEPLPGAAVGIEEPGAIEYTNSAGDFTFKDIKKGKYHLYIAHPEYENKIITVTVKKNFHIEVELGVRSFTGDTIDNRYYNAEDRFGGQYISGENIKDFPLRGAGDSLHLLQTLPGVGGGSYLSTVPIIRGGNPLYDRYYIDDIPVDFPYHYVGSIVPLFSSINENIIDTASVIKGTAPLNYDDTLGNIIHIKTKDPDEAGVHGKIQLDPVVPVLPSVYVTAVPLEDLSVTFAGRRSYADLVTDLDDVEVSFQDHYLKVSYNLFDNHRIYFISFGVDDYQAYKNFSARNTYTVWALKWEYLITKKYFLKTIISRYSTEQYFENTNIYQGMAGAYLKFNPLQYRIYQEFNAVVKNFYLKTGYEFLLHDNGVEGNITLSDLPDLDLLDNTGNSLTVRYPVEGKTISLFSEMGADFDPFWANLGVKFKYYGPLSNSSFSMRAMCGVNINNKNTVYGGGGLYHAHPDVYYYLGETEPGFNDSKAYNAVLGYKSEFLPNLTGQLELYYSSYKDLASVNIGMINNSEYKKITQFNPFSGEKEGTSYGAELSVKGNIKDFYGWVSYAFSVSKRSNDDNNLEDFYSDFDQTHLFKIAAAAKFGNWTPSVLLHLYSSLPYTPVTGATQNGSSYSPTYGDYNSERFPLHFRIDAKVTYTTEGNSRFYVEVWNVLYTQSNYLYQDFNSGSPYSNENPENKADLLPIFVWIGMELCF